MMPATTGTRPAAASTVAASSSRVSAASSAWPSPVLPPAASPCTPSAISQSTWPLTSSSCSSPSARNGVVIGGMMPESSMGFS